MACPTIANPQTYFYFYLTVRRQNIALPPLPPILLWSTGLRDSPWGSYSVDRPRSGCSAGSDKSGECAGNGIFGMNRIAVDPWPFEELEFTVGFDKSLLSVTDPGSAITLRSRYQLGMRKSPSIRALVYICYLRVKVGAKWLPPFDPAAVPCTRIP